MKQGYKCPRCGEDHGYWLSIRCWVFAAQGFRCKKCNKLFYRQKNLMHSRIVSWLYVPLLLIGTVVLALCEIPNLWIYIGTYLAVGVIGFTVFEINHTETSVSKSEQQVRIEALWGISPDAPHERRQISPIIWILLAYSIFMGFDSVNWLSRHIDVVGEWSKYLFVANDGLFAMVALFLILDALFMKGDFRVAKNFAMMACIFHILDFLLGLLQMLGWEKGIAFNALVCWSVMFNVGVPLIWLRVLHFPGFKKLFSQLFALLIRKG